MFRAFVAVIVFTLLACIEPGNSNQETQTQPADTKVKAADTELTARLYSLYFSDPKNQAELDQNALLDYAVDNGLDVTRTPTGLFYIIHKEGQGELMKKGQPCSAHYTGYFLDGKIFDTSQKKGKPINFNIGAMNAGWNEGLLYMNVGTKAQLLLPSHLGYGQRGFPGFIPPNTPIIFDIEIMPLG